MSYTLKLSTEGRPTLTDLRELVALADNFPGAHEVRVRTHWDSDKIRDVVDSIELVPAKAELDALAEGRDRMIDLYVTFGMKYAREPHPTFPKAHPDGWLRITAPTLEDAFSLIARRIGTAYAFYYTSANFEPHWHPMGELDHWTASKAEVTP